MYRNHKQARTYLDWVGACSKSCGIWSERTLSCTVIASFKLMFITKFHQKISSWSGNTHLVDSVYSRFIYNTCTCRNFMLLVLLYNGWQHTPLSLCDLFFKIKHRPCLLGIFNLIFCFQILECLSDPTVSQTAATAFNIILSEYPDVLHPSQHPNITSHLYKQRVFVYTFPKLHAMFKTIQPGKLITNSVLWYPHDHKWNDKSAY